MFSPPRITVLAVSALLGGLMLGCTGDKPARKNPDQAISKSPEKIALPQIPDNSVIPKPTDVRAPIHFTSMVQDSGIDFQHVSGNSPEKAFPAANGSGLASLDYDMDGLYDMYFGNGTTFPIDPLRSSPGDQLYRNRDDWKFRNATDVSGIVNPSYTAGVECGDFNNDGFPDIYVTSVGKNQLYLNLGDGTFEDISAASGTDDPQWATSAAFLDFDSDGLLDLYICSYAEWSLEHNTFCGDPVRKIRMYCSPTMVRPEPDVLFRNQGDGTFLNVSETTGIRVRSGRGQGVIAADLNGDRKIDLYVSNDINQNFLLLGDGKGQFQEAGELSGTAYDHLGKSQAGMGLALGDFDRNGKVDLFVTNYSKEHNALYENLGNGVFVETGTTRIPEGSLPYVGWGTSLSDFDLDGWMDLIVTNGHTDDNLAELGKEGEYLQQPGLWRNEAGRFRLLTPQGGIYFQELHNGRGLVSSDLDNDGDLDVAVGHQEGQPALLKNDSLDDPGNQSLRIRLIGNSDNRDAIGAMVEVESAERPLIRCVCGGGSYASTSDRRVVFGLEQSAVVNLRISWPDGTQRVATGLKAGNCYSILQEHLGKARIIEISEP